MHKNQVFIPGMRVTSVIQQENANHTEKILDWRNPGEAPRCQQSVEAAAEGRRALQL